MSHLDLFEIMEIALVECVLENDSVPILYIVHKSNTIKEDLFVEKLKSFYKENFESYTFPQRIILSDFLPKNEYGKLKRNELKQTLKGTIHE